MGRSNQPFTKFVEVGRVAYIAYGSNAGKICAIVDIIDQNRALVDGPCSGVQRHAISFNRLHLTKFLLSFKHSDKTKVVRKAWTAANISEKWAETKWAKSLQAKNKRRTLTDFDRFKLMLTKRTRNKMIEDQVAILRRKAKLAAKKAELDKKAEKAEKEGKPPKEVKPMKTKVRSTQKSSKKTPKEKPGKPAEKPKVVEAKQ